MLWVLIGLAAGIFWVLSTQAIPLLHTPADTFVTAISATADHYVSGLIHAAGLGSDTRLQIVLAAVASVIAPGLTCVAIAEASVLSKAARNAGAVVLSLLAFASFAVLPGPQALTLAVAALILNGLLAFARGPFLLLPLAAAVGVITASVLRWATREHSPLNGAVTALNIAHADAGLSRIALAAVAVSLCAGAALLMLRRA